MALVEIMARGISVAVLGTQIGFGGLLLHAFQHVWASALPSQNGYEFVELDLPRSTSRLSLRHSMVYEDAKAVDTIADWVVRVALNHEPANPGLQPTASM